MNSQKQSIDYNEATLLPLASKGDLDAFNQLVLHYQNQAYSHAYVLLRDTDAAEDATQESFIKAFEAMNSYRGGSFRSWLLKIVTNSAYDMLRRSQRHPNQPLYLRDANGEEMESASWLADPSTSVQNAVEQNELTRHIYSLLDELPEVYRSVITLLDINALNYAEAAEVLKVPIGTVRSRLARARMQMQNKLNEDLGHRIHFRRADLRYAT
jgi:RNA polymerase sigma-70 factor, ECF subfamily